MHKYAFNSFPKTLRIVDIAKEFTIRLNNEVALRKLKYSPSKEFHEYKSYHEVYLHLVRCKVNIQLIIVTKIIVYLCIICIC